MNNDYHHRALETTKPRRAALAWLCVDGSRFKKCAGSGQRPSIPDSQRAIDQ